MFVTVALPILFNIFISRAYLQSATPPVTLSQLLLDSSQDQQDQMFLLHDNHRHPHSNANSSTTVNNLTTLLLAQQQRSYLRSLSTATGASVEEQIAFGFADLTNRLRYAETSAQERRQEINQLMREIRYLWTVIHRQNDAQKEVNKKKDINSNSIITANEGESNNLKGKEL